MRSGDRACRARRDTTLARSTTIRDRLVCRQFQRSQDFCQKKPRSETPIDEHGTFAVPADAGLGRRREAILEGQTAIELMPVGKEAYRGYYRAWDLARIYAMIGEQDAAVAQLEYLLSIPGHLTVPWLRIDPTWDPLRNHPRFKKLLSGK